MVDVPAPISEDQATGNVVDPKATLGFDQADEMHAVYNPDDGALYLTILQVSDSSLHFYRSRSYLRNQWEQISPDGGHSAVGNRLGYPKVTPKGHLLVPMGDTVNETDSGRIVRTDNTSPWGDNITTVENSEAPLYWRYSTDANGDIYWGTYFPFTGSTRTLTVYKSTDDGQSFSSVGTFGSEDAQIHGIATAPHEDILGITFGDNDSNIGVARKDISSSATVNAMGTYGSNNYQAVPIVPLPNESGTANPDCTFITGSDGSKFRLNRIYLEITGSNTLTDELHYGVPPYNPQWQDRPFLTDIQFVGGAIAGLGINGTLLISDDGYHWAERPIEFERNDNFENTLASTPRHVVACGDRLTIVPKDVVTETKPMTTVYSAWDGSLESGPSAGTTLVREIPIHKWSEVRAVGTGSNNWGLRMRQRIGAGGNQATAFNSELLQLGSGGSSASETNSKFRGTVGDIQVISSDASTDMEWSIQVQRS